MNSKKIILRMLIILFSTSIIFTTSKICLAEMYSSVYGSAWNADGLTSMQIGQETGRTVSYRFRANKSGSVSGVQVYLGDYKGNGGQVLLQLRTDDGTSNHNPSGTVLTSSLVTDPMKQWNRFFAFNSPVQLQKDALYHLVFTNPASDPVNNWVSLNLLWNSKGTPNMQPGISDTDLACVWKKNSSSSWSMYYYDTPIYCLYYNDGTFQGQGYVDTKSISGVTLISGGNKVRETFTVSGTNRTVSKVSIRLKKSGSPGNLTVRLEYSNGTLIEEGTISASQISTSNNWVTYTFKNARSLELGKSYNLVLSAPAGDSYSIFPIVEGASSGFNCPEVYKDGHFQIISNSQWVNFGNNTNSDMQFYLTSLASLASTYGAAWNADGLTPMKIGQELGRAVSCRFRAKYSGNVYAVRILFAFSAPGYYMGNGGQILVQLQTDDGTVNHYPSGTVLTSALIIDPMKSNYRFVTFDFPVQLQNGALYHLVYTNPAPDPVNNWTSVDNLYNKYQTGTSPVQPGISDTDLFCVWKKNKDTPWANRYITTPIYCLYYNDGMVQGQGYVDALVQSGATPISGTNKVRETFTVSGTNRTVSKVSVRLKKSGSPGDLTVRLEYSNGTLIEEGTISASLISTSDNWATYTFKNAHTLEVGRNYNLVLSAPNGNAYTIYPIVEGTSGGLDCPELYDDGYFQIISNSQWVNFKSQTKYDMQFYFTK